MVKSDNLKELSIDELNSVIQGAEAAIKDKQRQQRSSVVKQIRDLAASIGMSVELRTEKKVRQSLPPKYRNPENPAETWKGRGPKPKWLKAAVAKGKSMDDLLIK
ncbi:MAG: H-NS histone family protein [Gammaproteobacteria bacterium]|nr:H-NS histone family protein [Gammaproteobacteria bacterium]